MAFQQSCMFKNYSQNPSLKKSGRQCCFFDFSQMGIAEETHEKTALLKNALISRDNLQDCLFICGITSLKLFTTKGICERRLIAIWAASVILSGDRPAN